MSFINDVLKNVEKTLLGEGVESAIDFLASKVVSGSVLPGDIDIKSITLLSEDEQRKYNLTSQVTGMQIYESIFAPVIVADIVVADAMGLYEKFPIICEEYIAIRFRTPKTKSPAAKYLFRVMEVKNKQVAENNKLVTYTLRCMSTEIMRNLNTVITSRLDGSASSIIESVLKEDLKTNKPCRVDSTTGIIKYPPTRLQPLKAIDYCRLKARSVEDKSQSFVFFENRNGYNFTTIEKLMDNGGKLVSLGSDKEFFFDTARKESVADVTSRNILAYNRETFTDAVSKVSMLTSEIQTFDFVTGGIQKITYTDNVGSDQFKTADKNSAGTASSTFSANHGKSTASKKIIAVSGTNDSSQVAEKFLAQQSYANKLVQNIVHIEIYGDSEITVGDVIKCSFPSSTSNGNDKSISRLDSGNYLVAKVMHMIILGDRAQHIMSLELIKGGFTAVA